MLSKQEQLRKKILYKFVENNSISKRKIATELNTTIRTVQRVIKRYVDTGTVQRKSESGRKRKFVDRNLELKVLKSLQKNPNPSIRDLARNHGTTKSTVQKIKQRHSIKSYKKVKVPKRDLRQHTTAKSRANKLYKRITSKNFRIMMDDETYCKLDFKSLPGQHYFSGKDKISVKDEFKLIKPKNIKQKLLKYAKPATSIDNFKNEWKKKTRMITDQAVQDLKGGVKRKLRKFWMDLE
ncbi:hypothetical protein ILUMI_10302 [Ignelater luminosus]|uniref:Uncharacterized protein n=1 Tax=Ignelater luminosus TaxID=2038154 RepID=A0A8K0D456_IGNLU|nr:hypothetical protein ILUMI_10302 [Ignelater luminosus]